MKRLLPDVLLSGESGTGAECRSLYECRHCGTKYDEQRHRCAVCGSAEIATYTFPGDGDDGDA